MTTLKNKALETLKAVWAKIQAEPVIIKTALAALIAGGYLNFLTDEHITLLQNLAAVAVFVITAVSLRSDVKPLPPKDRGSIIPGLARRKQAKQEDITGGQGE